MRPPRRLSVALVVALSSGGGPATVLAVEEAPGIDLVRPVRGAILRYFEPPPTPFAAGHRGIDLAAAEGTAVVAAADGTVAFAGQVAGSLFVSVDHARGYRSTYSFLSRLAARAGVVVRQGEVLGWSGSGHGHDMPPHLHFGLRLDGEYVDPEPLLLEGMRRDLSRVIRLVA